MAVTYGFYNALNHDRLYDAIQMSSIFDGIIRDGIFSTIGTSMTVTAPEDGLYVNVGPGRAWFNHTWTLNDTEYPVEAEEAEVVLDRIDAVILEVNSAAEVRANSIKFLKGTPASEPVKPTLTHNAEVNQYALAYVRIRAGQSTIFQADVENAVGTDETPFVTGLMQQVSIENLILQWEAEFDDHFENWRNINEAEFEVWSQEMQDEYNTWILNQVNTYQTWFAGIQAEAGDDIDEVMAWFQHMKDQISEDAAIRLQEEIDELAESAEKGSVVTIHTINDTLYGKNCVISQDGQSRTARFDNTGTAVFESIPYVGQVTVTATDGTLTAVTYLTIPYFGRYTTNLAFWAATVNISTQSPEFFSLPIKVFKNDVLIETIAFSALGAATYIATSEGTYKFSVTYDNTDFDHTIVIDEETTYTVVINDWNATLNMKTSVDALYGRGITISKGGVTVGTTTFNGSGHATYKVHEPGTYHIVTSTAGGDTYSADVVVTEETAYPVDLGLPNGSTVLPTDDIQTWLHCAGINDKGYTTLAEVLEDSVTYNALLGDSNACDYMARSTTFAGIKIPIMTGYTTPSGEASASSEYRSGNYPAYRAFNETTTTFGWLPAAISGSDWVQYEFASAVKASKLKIKHVAGASSGDYWTALVGKLQGSNDGTTFIDILDNISTPTKDTDYYFDLQPDDEYKYYRYTIKSATPSSIYGYGIKIQLYTDGITFSQYAMSLLGRYDYACEAVLANETWAEAIANSEYWESVLDVKIPTMTGYTTPSGEVFPNNGTGTYAWWHAFDDDISTRNEVTYESYNNRLGYKFPSSVKCACAKIGGYPWQSATYRLETFKIVASNDNSTWVELTDTISNTATASGDIQLIPFTKNVDNYQYYAINVLTSGSSSDKRVQIESVQFYGRHASNLIRYNPEVPVMTSNTTPSGVASASNQYGPNAAYYAMNGDSSNQWVSADNQATNSWLKYEFPTAVKALKFRVQSGMDSSHKAISSYKIQGSNDDSTWVDLYTGSNSNQTFDITADLNNNTEYKYYRLFVNSTLDSTNAYCKVFQLYTEYQANLIHSAANDTVYYLNGNSPVTVCTTDANGIGEFDLEDLPKGSVTLYSTVAKDPNNLSNPYSKTVIVTGETTEIYLMPDGALYWYGWKSSDLEDVSSWTPYSGMSMRNPTFNTDSITVSMSAINQMGGIGSKSTHTCTKVHSIGSGTGGAYMHRLYVLNSKSFTSWVSEQWVDTQNTVQHLVANVTSGDYYVSAVGYNNAANGATSATIYALWYE